MGTMCANKFEKEEGTNETVDTYKNSPQLSVQLG